MTTLHPQSTVGELVKTRPARSRLFEKLGIDYCCGGKLPLADACGKRGLNVDDVMHQLAQLDSESHVDQGEVINADAMGLAELADHIEQTHHAYLKEELPRLESGIQKVAAVHGHLHPWMREVASVYASFSAEMQAHMLKEEQLIFPQIRRLEDGQRRGDGDSQASLHDSIRDLEHDHDSAGQALARFRILSHDYTPPEGACNTFRAVLDRLSQLEQDTHQHVHKENNVLFPKAIKRESSTGASCCKEKPGRSCSIS